MKIKSYKYQTRSISMYLTLGVYTVVEDFDSGRPNTVATFTAYEDADDHFSCLVNIDEVYSLLYENNGIPMDCLLDQLYRLGSNGGDN